MVATAIRFAFLLVFPAVALAISEGVYAYRRSVLQLTDPGLTELSHYSFVTGASCPNLTFGPFMPDENYCVATFGMLRTSSLLSISAILLSAFLLVGIWIAVSIAKGSQSRLAALLLPGMWLTISGGLVLVLLMICAVAILFYLLGIVTLPGMTVMWIIMIGMATVLAIRQMFEDVRSAVHATPNLESTIMVSRSDQPRLWDVIDGVTAALHASPPQYLLCGLKPNFYATADDVNISGKVVPGEKIYISLPRMRTMNVEELQAILGHELSHFTGDDCRYSLHFIPNIFRLFRAAEALGHSPAVAGLPSYIVLCHFLDQFTLAHLFVSRDRELEADRSSARVVGAIAMASSLAKGHVLSHLYRDVEAHIDEHRDSPEGLQNAPEYFEQTCRDFLQHVDRTELLEWMASQTISHPTDTHPPLSVRLAALEISLEDAGAHLELEGEPASSLVAGLEALEEQLTKASFDSAKTVRLSEFVRDQHPKEQI